MTIYIDRFFATNFILNFFILHVTKTILKSDSKNYKIALCAALGSVYSILILFPIQKWILVTLWILVTSFAVWICFCDKSAKGLFRATVIFYCVAFITGGCALALQNTLKATQDYELGGVLMLCIAISYILISAVGDIVKKLTILNKNVTNLNISYNKKQVSTKAFCDTGNHLTDPVTKKPVIVVSLNSIKDILPSEMVYSLLHNEDVLKIYTSFCTEHRLKLIPYKAISGDGFLLGIKPDEIKINNNPVDAVVAISCTAIHTLNDYSAIFGPQIIKNKEAFTKHGVNIS